MKNSIIVTVKFGGNSEDMELPYRLPIRLLSKRLLNALQTLNPIQFGHMHGLWIVHQGRYLLDEDASLQDYGMCDGDYLTVAEMKGSFRES